MLEGREMLVPWHAMPPIRDCRIQLMDRLSQPGATDVGRLQGTALLLKT